MSEMEKVVTSISFAKSELCPFLNGEEFCNLDKNHCRDKKCRLNVTEILVERFKEVK